MQDWVFRLGRALELGSFFGRSKNRIIFFRDYLTFSILSFFVADGAKVEKNLILIHL